MLMKTLRITELLDVTVLKMKRVIIACYPQLDILLTHQGDAWSILAIARKYVKFYNPLSMS